METCKTFVNEDGQTFLACPLCRLSTKVPVGQFRNIKRFLKVKCKCCGTPLSIELEYRITFRKATKLDGFLQYKDEKLKYENQVKVINLSLGGSCLEIDEPNHLRVGSKGNLEFTLDDKKESIIIKQIVVLAIDENTIRCRFPQVFAFAKNLGSYIRA